MKFPYRNLKTTLVVLILGQLVFVTFKKDSKPISNKHRTYIRVDSFLHYEGESYKTHDFKILNNRQSKFQVSTMTSDRITFATCTTTADILIWSWRRRAKQAIVS